MILIGIDPGTDTGMARWDSAGQRLLSVESMPIHVAMERIRIESGSIEGRRPLVMVEDARQHRIWRGKTFGDTNRLQGAGSVKRDCAIWDDYLTDIGVPFMMRKPDASKKIKADQFNQLTGWPCRSNNHGRDAAMIVYGINLPMAMALLAQSKRGKA